MTKLIKHIVYFIVLVLCNPFAMSDVFAQPSNDDCANAIDITCDIDVSPCTNYSMASATESMSTASCLSSCAGGPGNNIGHDIWFSFTTCSTDDITITFTHDQSWDPTTTYYDGCGGSELSCSPWGGDGTGNDGTKTHTLTGVSDATTYYFRIDGDCNTLPDICLLISSTGGGGCYPTANAGSDATICEGSTYALSGASIGGTASSQTWSGGDGSFSPNNTVLNPTYDPGATDISMGTVTLTITTDDPDGAGPCVAASDDMVLTINACTGATWSLGANSTLVRTRSTSSDNWQNQYEGGISNIPATAYWILRKTDGDDPTITSDGAFYPNLTIENNTGSPWATGAGSKFTGSSGYPTVKGTFDIGGAGSNTVTFLNDNTNATATMVQGDLIIQSANTLQNYGTGFEIQGDFNVIGAVNYDAATPTLVFSGGNAQSILGAGTINIYDMEVNKALNELTLTRVITVDNVLTLTLGELVLNGFTLTIANGATTAMVRADGSVVSETNAATNNSILQWNIGSTTGNHVFPFGTTAGDYIPVTFNNNGNASGNVSISTRPSEQDGTPEDNSPWATGVTMMAGAGTNITSAADRWWDISCGTNPVVGGADVTFSYLGTENSTTTDATAIRGIQHWNGSVWNDGKGGADGTVTSSSDVGVTGGVGAVSVIGLTEFSPFIVVKAAAPLPIELLQFDAKPNIDKVDLSWATASETNNDYFTIERSTDAADFDIVVKVPGAGNSTHTLHYSAVDEDPYYGISYYRLKQTDYDGRYEYSELVAVKFLRKLNFSVRPNPAHDYLEITFGEVSKNVIFVMTPEYDASIKIYDARGELVYKKEFNGTFYKFNIDISSFSQGIYFVSLTANNELYKAKFVKE